MKNIEKIPICDCGEKATVQYCTRCTGFRQNEYCSECLYRCKLCAKRLG